MPAATLEAVRSAESTTTGEIVFPNGSYVKFSLAYDFEKERQTAGGLTGNDHLRLHDEVRYPIYSNIVSMVCT
jgi:hypothetical protein